jgi:UDP-N-acetylglucosamine 2-epimerase
MIEARVKILSEARRKKLRAILGIADTYARMAQVRWLTGDGHAAERIVETLVRHLAVERPALRATMTL